MNSTLQFLLWLTKRLPVGDRRGAHSITVDQTDDADLLRVTLAGYTTADGQQRPSFTFTPDDLGRDPEELVDEIVEICQAQGVVALPIHDL